jgi:hypothetical protein
MIPHREQGWECPKCSRIWAPKIGACGACNVQSLPPAPPAFDERLNPRWNFTGDDSSYVD